MRYTLNAVLPYLLLACALAGCASLDSKLQSAETVATTALSSCTTLLTAGKITLAVDQQCRKYHDATVLLIHDARDLESRGDTTGAEAKLTDIEATVALIQSLVGAH